MLTKPSIRSARRLYVRKSLAESGGKAPSAFSEPVAFLSLPIEKEGREETDNKREEREARMSGGVIIPCRERIERQLHAANYRVSQAIRQGENEQL